MILGFSVGCGAIGTASPGSDFRIYPTKIPLDDGRAVTCIVFDNTSYEGDSFQCNLDGLNP